ncbi:Ligand-gated ion channel [Ancylostoma caninum]|uniref:Ligand-gated ion channel n=1 Tax=Ancylostoma caninum TaxID=29170 RepID=A0A368FQN3_ANCCA|nr:Ligand-gated ion channel [Ancylostoma caninum]
MSLSQVKKDNVSGDEGAESVRPVHVIVDLEGGYRMRMFLRALDESVLVKKEYHYVFANFEMEDADLASFHYSLINITGFQLFDRMDKKFLQNKKLFEDMYRERISTVDYLPASSAFAHDALLVAASALDRTVRKHGLSIFSRLWFVFPLARGGSFSRHQLFNRGLPGLYCRPHEDRDHPDRKFEPFEFGDEIAESIKEVVLTQEDGTLTGRIQFDPHTGWRTNYSATVIEIKPGVNSLNSIKEVWRRIEITRIMCFSSVKPFVMLRRSNPGDPQHKGNDRFEGYCIDLLKLLAKNISGFEYNIFVSEGNKYGARQPDGSWDGMLGYLLNETADIAVAPLTITQERERAVDFSKPFMTTGLKPEKQEFNIFSFMEPLGMRIWIFTLCSYVGVSLTIFLVSSFSPYEQRVQFNRGEFSVSNEFSMYNSLWFTLAAFMQQGTDILPKALSGRIASSAWWFFTLIIVSSYTANLAAFLTLEKMTPPIESVEDLANQNKILYGVVKGGSTAAFFEDSTVPLYKRMWDFMQDEHNKFLRDQVSESVFVDTYAEGIDRVRKSKGRYAFLLEETTNNYEGGRKPCNTMKVGQNLNTLGYGIATKIGNPLRHALLCNMSSKSPATFASTIAVFYSVDHILQRFDQLGNSLPPGEGRAETAGEQVVDSGASSSLNLSKVAGIFYILMCGMVLSMLTALVEFLVRKKKENREKEKKRQLALRQRPVIASACNRFNKRRTKSEEGRSSLSAQF